MMELGGVVDGDGAGGIEILILVVQSIIYAQNNLNLRSVQSAQQTLT